MLVGIGIRVFEIRQLIGLILFIVLIIYTILAFYYAKGLPC